MKLSQISAKPKLIMVTIDDNETIEKYKEAITFHTWDRQPMEIFIQLANVDQTNPSSIINIVHKLILDEKGKPILDDDNMLPPSLLMKAITKVTEILGK